jgi:hypothetical protein
VKLKKERKKGLSVLLSMRGEKMYTLSKCFSTDEYGFAEIPMKFSNVKLSRIKNGELMGCSYCFPHGRDTINNHWVNRQRSWKTSRKKRWKDS